jgi:hypothetical protein
MPKNPKANSSSASQALPPKQKPFLIRLRPELDELRMFYEEGGLIAALHDALWLLLESGHPAPEWVVSGACKIVRDRLEHPLPTGDGATGNEKADYRSKMKHFHRWRCVTSLVQNGVPWADVYAKAAAQLDGTFAEGGEETIKKSYQRVQKDLTDPQKAARYYQARQVTRVATGTSLY